jgi:DNA-binding transcriptional MerR regulator
VPISSIKFYIREGLLAAGERRGPNQADYGEAHLERLDLIRALREVGGLSVELTKHVLSAVDQPRWQVHPLDLALEAIYAKAPAPSDDPDYQRARSEVHAFLGALPWTVPGDEAVYERDIVDALVKIRRYAWADFPASALEGYARAAWAISAFEFDDIPGGLDPIAVRAGRADAVKDAVLGTVLFEPILLALRRHAHRARMMRLQAGAPVPPPR